MKRKKELDDREKVLESKQKVMYIIMQDEVRGLKRKLHTMREKNLK